MTDYKKYINALRKCAKEHENDRTFTGHIIVSDLCQDTANLLEELEQEPRWIPVSERWPDKNGRYLVTVKQGYITFGAWVDEAKNWAGVTAWMPLPKPYEPQESEGV